MSPWGLLWLSWILILVWFSMAGEPRKYRTLGVVLVGVYVVAGAAILVSFQ